MIIGVTHDPDGRAVQRLSVSTKVGIGMPPQGDRNYPCKLDHFVFLRKKKTPKGVEWEPDPELMRHYGSECRAVQIMLIDDDIDNVFPTAFAWWTAIERKCWGDGTCATRRTPAHPSGEPWTSCGSQCPELVAGLCKPSGDLRFVLADFPRLGSICRIHTSSYRSICQIHSALEEIQTFTGGRLAGRNGKLHLLSVLGGDSDVAAVWAAVHHNQSFRVEGPGLPSLESSLGDKAECHRGSLSIADRKRPVRHLVAVSAELAQTRLGAATESNRTILLDHVPAFALYRLSERFGLPVVPGWADWFMTEMKRRRAIRPLTGLGCSPVLITGTKARFLSWISRGLRRGAISFPVANGPVRWPAMAGFLDPERTRSL